jgi:hypothetical protein
MEHVEVLWRHHREPVPALRNGIVLAWNYTHEADVVTPNAGRTLTERDFVLLDVGVKIVNPCWWGFRERDTWYVDLVTVEQQGNLYIIRDLYIDLVVPTDGRAYRTLDLEEFADAMESGAIDLAAAADGLKRWQRFLDRYIHATGSIDTAIGWTDFPPHQIEVLADLPAEAFAAPDPVAVTP